MDPHTLVAAALLAAGVLLVALAFVDAVITTLATPELGGPLTRLLSSTLWRGVRLVTSRSQSTLLRAAGPLVTLTVLTAWVSTLGATPREVLIRHWDGTSFAPLLPRLEAVTEGLIRLRTENLAYPVLHFFHGADPDRALAPRVAAIDEAMTIIEHGVAAKARPPARNLLPLRETIDALLHTIVSQTFARPGHEVPPAPALESLGTAGIPTVPQEDFAAALSALDDRRCRLLSYVNDDSWGWQEVVGTG